MFVVHGGTSYATPAGTSNWLADGFAEALESEAMILQDLPFDAFTARAARPAFPSTFTFADALSRVETRTRLEPLGGSDRARVAAWAEEVYRHFAHFGLEPDRVRTSIDQLVYRSARIRHLDAEFARVLDRVQPSTIYMQTAAYGDRASMISIAHRRGIGVAELQHGWIGPCHAAYNFGAAMRSPELNAGLPDTLLTFGEFWSEAVRFPGATVAIGKPHLDARSSEAEPVSARENLVLVASSVYEREQLTEIVRRLRDALPEGWNVLFRPHPSELATVADLYSELLAEDRVILDRDRDVYASLGRVRAVVGFASTVLYEALAFGCQVAAIDSPLADLYIEDRLFGERIGDGGSVVRAAERFAGADRAVPAGGTPLEDIWKPGAAENLVAFSGRQQARRQGRTS
ncbi:hypothetical protein GCM10025870_08250 [Agromyces marinus]|uniref:CDP-Glycerol:Poly(Glycerophosphate) glycerophosphotransferase n=2 Tax=Agromyces marinus TaxID=1389020 RepID=A0ABM8GZ71_9MICO|nr:hypothetical protein [Agromyces marinus]BDZ53752.1 hypothetical protein GCM10025870_08250 [Agromyces marinus]